MDGTSTSTTKMDMLEVVVVKDAALSSAELEMQKDVVVKDTALPSISAEVEIQKDVTISIDTMDKKRGQNYSAKQANSFAAKKTVAQGMMDVALITANANQLRYLIEYQQSSPTFYLIMILIIISLLLQIAVGVSLIFKGRFDIKGKSNSLSAQRINNYVVVGVFLITIINVFIAAFSISVPNTQPLSVITSTSRI